MVTAVMTLPMLPRVSAISAMASRIGGMLISPSITRMMLPSSQRTNPDTRPMKVPMAVASAATAKPTVRDTRARKPPASKRPAPACPCRTSTAPTAGASAWAVR